MKFRTISGRVSAIVFQSGITVPAAGLGISVFIISHINKTMLFLYRVTTISGLPHLPSSKEIVDKEDCDSNDYRWHNYANHDGDDVDTGGGGVDTGCSSIETG